jgi:multidrug efflux system membrane fusion protein
MNKPSGKKVLILARVIVCVCILLVGVGISRVLVMNKKPPQVHAPEERTLLVSGIVVKPGSYDVPIRGFGEVRSLNAVMITPQVSGLVTAVHPRLEVGGIIGENELLFELDDREFRARQAEAAAGVALQVETISRLEAQSELDKARLVKLARNQELAQSEWHRVNALFVEQQVGTQSGVEAAERAFNLASDQTAILDRAVKLYPAHIREAQNSQQALEARLRLASLDLERCAVRLANGGRVTDVAIEVGQLVGPARSVVSLADDRQLEIHVPIDSRDARDRLLMHDDDSGALRRMPCLVQWTEDASRDKWAAQLDRIVRFDSASRMLIVAVRLNPEDAFSQTGRRPAEGMFCRVDIPSVPLRNTYKLPREAVSFEGDVYLSISNRLRTVQVEITRMDENDVYVAFGLHPGQKVITTRLVNPLEGSHLEWRANTP